jgi:hypothetical protein
VRNTTAKKTLASPADSPSYLAHDEQNIAVLICPEDRERGEAIWREVMTGDAEAALEALQLAPCENRGRIVRVAYRAKVPNPAFRVLLLETWLQYPEWVAHAAGSPGARESTLMCWCARAGVEISELAA